MPRERKQEPARSAQDRFLRSINIVYDAESVEGISHFHPTSKTADLLRSLLIDDQERCFFVVAPYGSGKSLAATFALHLMENREASRPHLRPLVARLAKVSTDLGNAAQKRLRSAKKKGLVIPMHGYAPDLAVELKESTLADCRRLGLTKSVRTLSHIPCQKAPDMAKFLAAASATWNDAGIDRVALVWDEFGKHVESLITSGASSDLLDLQVLVADEALALIPGVGA